MSSRGLLWLGLLAAPAWALPPVSASLGYSAQVISTRSFDFVAGQDHLAQLRAGAGLALGLGPGFLDLELALATGGTNEVARQRQTALTLWEVEAGVGFRLPWRRFFHPYLRLGVGWDWVSLTVTGLAPLSQTVNNISGTGMLGAQIPFKLGPQSSRAPTLLIDLGLGYTLRPGAGFHRMMPVPQGPRVEDPIPQSSTDLGTLPLSGISYRVLTTLRL